MAQHPSPFDRHFRRLLELNERGEGEELFAELLHHGPSLFGPLSDFLIRHPPAAELAILLDLLSKCLDDRAIPLLMRFLESDFSELRRAAANGLGWNRARVGLEALDELEGSDPEEAVRLEARLAIEEILQAYPKLRSLLHHHEPLGPMEAGITGEFDDVPNPASGADSHQRVALIRALPRLLALKYGAVPIHVSPGGILHLAVPGGSERRLISPLAELTGHSVQLHSWTKPRIRQVIEGLYSLGDDDFCAFPEALTERARDEVIEEVIAGIHPADPVGPLDEASDAVEAAQTFLSSTVCMELKEVEVRLNPPGMTIRGTRADGGTCELAPPGERLRERFLATLRLVARLGPMGKGASPQEAGVIRCCKHEPHFLARVSTDKLPEGQLLHIIVEALPDGQQGGGAG